MRRALLYCSLDFACASNYLACNGKSSGVPEVARVPGVADAWDRQQCEQGSGHPTVTHMPEDPSPSRGESLPPVVLIRQIKESIGYKAMLQYTSTLIKH